MDPQERSEAIRRLGYRERMPAYSHVTAMGAVTFVGSLVLIGGFGVVFGDDLGMRARGLAMFVIGLPLAIWGGRWLLRPVVPDDDSDLERELRYLDRPDPPA